MITEEVQLLCFCKFRATLRREQKIQCGISELAVSIPCTEEGKDPSKETACDQIIKGCFMCIERMS